MIYFIQENFQYCCGVDEIGGFTRQEGNNWNYLESRVSRPGTGYFICTFINNSICKEAYHQLADDGHKVVFQSTPRQNGRGNRVFVVVYLHKDCTNRLPTPKKVKDVPLPSV